MDGSEETKEIASGTPPLLCACGREATWRKERVTPEEKAGKAAREGTAAAAAPHIMDRAEDPPLPRYCDACFERNVPPDARRGPTWRWRPLLA